MRHFLHRLRFTLGGLLLLAAPFLTAANNARLIDMSDFWYRGPWELPSLYIALSCMSMMLGVLALADQGLEKNPAGWTVLTALTLLMAVACVVAIPLFSPPRTNWRYGSAWPCLFTGLVLTVVSGGWKAYSRRDRQPFTLRRTLGSVVPGAAIIALPGLPLLTIRTETNPWSASMFDGLAFGGLRFPGYDLNWIAIFVSGVLLLTLGMGILKESFAGPKALSQGRREAFSPGRVPTLVRILSLMASLLLLTAAVAPAFRCEEFAFAALDTSRSLDSGTYHGRHVSTLDPRVPELFLVSGSVVQDAILILAMFGVVAAAVILVRRDFSPARIIVLEVVALAVVWLVFEWILGIRSADDDCVVAWGWPVMMAGHSTLLFAGVSELIARQRMALSHNPISAIRNPQSP